MLYRLLTGSAPYEASRDTRGALEEAVLTAIPANPSSVIAALDVLDARQTTASALRRALAGDIDTIVAKALKKDADERYPTAAAFAADLRRNLARQPIAARPDSAWYRARRFYARHPFAVAASTLAITALLASFCVTVWHARETAATLVRANTAAARGANAQKFLTSMFASADPERSKSNELASVEILQRGTVAAERDFADDPEGHALVLKQIADIYRRMSMFDEVLATQQRRLAVLQGAPSADVDSLVEAELEVGRALGDTSHDADHQRAMAQLLNARERAERFGAKPENVVWALSLIADQFRFERNLVAARHHAEQALDLAQKALSSPNRFFAITYEVNALVATDQRRVEDARSYFKKALDIDATGQGRGPIDQFLSRNYLAQLEFVDGRYGAALEQSMLGIELAKKNFGGMNISLVEAIRTAAFAAAQHGDIATAERLAAAPLDAEVATGQTLRAGVAHFTRARVALHAGDVPRARVELTAAQSRVAGSAVWEPRVTLARSMLELRANNAQGAFEIATALLQSQVAKRGASHPELSATYQWLALTEYRTGRHEAARAHLQLALNGYSALRAAHPLRIRCAAYAVLMNPDLASAAKSEELLRLERVLAMDAGDAGEASPLAISLRRSKDSLATLKNNVWPNAAFPILD